jgi:hypothetical protein
MLKMNARRILLSGLVAGLVMNVGEAALHGGVLGKDTETLYRTLNVPFPNPSLTLPLLIGVAFLMGIFSMWLYAAIYSRFESRARTAIIAGLLVWFFAHVWSGVYLGAGYSGIFTSKLAWLPVVWGLFEATLAVFIGALLYKE